MSQLSIPRDTLVNVPGHGQTKINEAYFWGGSALAVKVVSSYTGVPINHVMLVSFHGFPALVTASAAWSSPCRTTSRRGTRAVAPCTSRRVRSS